MNKRKAYVGEVVEENGELFLVFPKEMIDELGWREGDNIVWEFDEGNGNVMVKRDNENP